MWLPVGDGRRGWPGSRSGCRCRRPGWRRRASRSVNGAAPTQGRPSPPMWLEMSVLRVGEARHVVAADAGQGARAFRQAGRGVVRAAGAEERLARLFGAQASPPPSAAAETRQIVVHAAPCAGPAAGGRRSPARLPPPRAIQLARAGMALFVDLADDLRRAWAGRS